jgi:prepilin-type N-terminal cleavage/methylation domain-containing protein
MATRALPDRGFRGAGRAPGGFTLLELIVAVTLLATFVLPILYVVTAAKERTYRFTQERKVQELAQRKLFDVIHYYETNQQGTFEQEGYSLWTWEVFPPEVRGQSDSEQVLLEYRISVNIPNWLGGTSSPDSEGLATTSAQGEGHTYEYVAWTFPDERWYEEQMYLYESGQNSLLYGDPYYGDSTMPLGGTGTYGGY